MKASSLIIPGLLVIGLVICLLQSSLFPNKESQLKNSYAAGIAKMDEGMKRAAEAAYNLGQLNETHSKFLEAREYYLKTLEFDPNHKKAQEALDKLETKLK